MMRKRRGFTWLSAFMIIAGVVAATPSVALGDYAYDLTILDPWGTSAGARDINNSGQVIGTARAPVSTNDATYGFVWEGGAYRFLGFLSAEGNSCPGIACYNDNNPYAINSSGQVVGYSWTSAAASHAYIITPDYTNADGDGNPWFTAGATINFTRNTRIVDIQTTMPGTTTNSTALGINDAGEAVGWYQYTNGGTVNTAFLYSGGTSYDIGAGMNTPSANDINNADQVTGDYQGGSNYLSFAWTDDNPHNNAVDTGELKASIGHLGGSVTRAQALNDDGQVVGTSSLSSPYSGLGHAFIWEDDGTTFGHMTDLGVLDATWANAWSGAYDINNPGHVVGVANLPYVLDEPGMAGFIWKDGTMTDLNDLIDPSLGFHIASAAAINDLGWIVGRGHDPATDPYGYDQVGFIMKLTGASSAFPMLPDPASPPGHYTFAAQLTTGGAGDGASADPIYLEAPIVAGMPGYEFIVAPGGSLLGDHLFTSVLVPAQGAGFLDDGDLLALYYGGMMYDLWVGSKYLLPNVSEFAIGGLDLSGVFPDSFLVGVTFNHASTAEVTLTPYSGDYEGGGDGTEPVPEPATLLLLGSGLAGLWLVRRRRKAAAS